MTTFSKDDVFNKSIILIGPMCAGKSTIASLLQQKLNIKQISLDNRKQLAGLYKEKENFDNEKEFDLYLVTYTLLNLKEPTIIDFGRQHSLYENKEMFNKMKELLKNFKNVVLLMPCQEKEKASLTLRNRKLTKLGKISDNLDNYSIYSSCNYDLATIIQYTNGKSFRTIVEEIIGKSQNS